MTLELKPYRLINDLELDFLYEKIKLELEQWNIQHALFPLSAQLNRLNFLDQNSTDASFMTENQPIALFCSNPGIRFTSLESALSLIKYCLFGDVSKCFNSAAQSILVSLLNTLIDTSALDVTSCSEWFYQGSPSLKLTLSSGPESMVFYLHPQWVISTLPKREAKLIPLLNYEVALSEQSLRLNVELSPIKLLLNDLMNLQVGDVIQTDHLLSQELKLKHQQNVLISGELGKHESYKSIQISRFP